MGAKLAGSAGRRYDVGQNHDLNVTPFVDVLLVLLIIFMVAAPMATTALQLNLPPNGPATPAKPPTFISIADSGQIYISLSPTSMKATTLASLAADLAPLAGPADQVFIRADKHVRYGQFVAVMDRLHTDGYGHVGLISEA
jgi:biopolymer transport protein ExbD